MNRKTIIWLCIGIVLPVVLLLLAKQIFGVSQDELISWLSGFRQSEWAIPLTLFLFVALAFIGAPQWMLVTAAIVTFGPWLGSLVSWMGSLLSAVVGFGIGKKLGADRLARIDADLVRKLSRAVQRNGFMTSLAVRLVPTGPALLVNLAAGVSGIKFAQFTAGTTIGIIPKIVIIALLSQGLISGLSGSLLGLLFAAIAVVAFIASYLARRKLATSTLAEQRKSQ